MNTTACRPSKTAGSRPSSRGTGKGAPRATAAVSRAVICSTDLCCTTVISHSCASRWAPSPTPCYANHCTLPSTLCTVHCPLPHTALPPAAAAACPHALLRQPLHAALDALHLALPLAARCPRRLAPCALHCSLPHAALPLPLRLLRLLRRVTCGPRCRTGKKRGPLGSPAAALLGQAWRK